MIDLGSLLWGELQSIDDDGTMAIRPSPVVDRFIGHGPEECTRLREHVGYLLDECEAAGWSRQDAIEGIILTLALDHRLELEKAIAACVE